MSLQVVARKPVGNPSRGSEGAEWPSRPDVGRARPPGTKAVVTLTCRDVFDEVRRRLAQKEFHWD